MVTGEGSVGPEWSKAIPQSEFGMLLLEKSYGDWRVKNNSVYHYPYFTDKEIWHQEVQWFILKTTEVKPGL